MHAAVFRRLATLSCGFALVVALAFAAVHQHHEAESSSSRAADASCLLCSGGVVPSEAPRVEPAARRMWAMPEAWRPEPPALRRRLPLDHSGNAPPA